MSIVPTRLSDCARFWAKVVKEETERVAGLGPCWIWNAACHTNGYGAFLLRGKQRQAHIVSYEWHIAPVPPGLLVCHSCDIRACVNPEHLFVGTQAENLADASAKGRLPSGLENAVHRLGLTTLSEADVLEIRRLTTEGIRQTNLAERFGVSQTMISRIGLGKAWRHLLPADHARRALHPRPCREAILSIRAMALDGIPQSQIARAHGVTQSTVSRIANRLVYQDID